jgi:flagellar hook-basal body complex protein FliE
MEPLSALRQFAPAFTTRVPKTIDDAGRAGGSGGAIPAAELRALNPDLPISTIDSGAGVSFDNTLSRLVNDVSAKQTAASDAVRGLVTGQNVSLHQAMISMEEASVSFQLMVEVRNKLLESYQELMRMQI